MATWRGPRGIEIEVIQLDARCLYKVTQTVRSHRYLLGYCASVAEVAEHVDLADLVELIDFPG